MFKPVRVVATIIFLASIGLIFVGAFVIRSDVSAHITITPKIQAHATLSSSFASVSVNSKVAGHMPLTLLFVVFVIIEYLAYTWYTLSYIPYARTAVLKVFGM